MGRLTSYCLALGLCALWPGAGALAAGTQGISGHAGHHMSMQHHKQSAPTAYRMANVVVPHISLVREDRKRVALDEELNDGRPVFLNFIYTTCTETCPLTTHTFEALQDKLGDQRSKVNMVSISIDPEQDTPSVLAKYAVKFAAGKQWHFYTGTLAASIAAQRAFNVYWGDKMDHNPVTFIRIAPGKPWLRIDGLATPGELLAALRELKAGKSWMKEAAPSVRHTGVHTPQLAGDPSAAFAGSPSPERRKPSGK